MPPTALPALRGERRGLLVLTAGPAPYYFYWRYPTGPVDASQSDLTARGFWPSSFARGPTEGREGLKTMTRTEHNRAARRRGELTGDRGSRRLSPAIDAQRRLNARQADATQTDTD